MTYIMHAPHVHNNAMYTDSSAVLTFVALLTYSDKFQYVLSAAHVIRVHS